MRINGKRTVLIPHVVNRADAGVEYPEILATSMLLGEGTPITCSTCLGSQYGSSILMRKLCPECDGAGYHFQEKTRWALIKRYHGEGAEERV